jgi:replicative DNA helicase
MSIFLEKTPPHSNDAEQSLLATILINSKCLDDIEGLSASDFYSGPHRKIFESILAVKKRDGNVDLVTVAQEMKSRDTLDEAGGPAYLTKLVDTAPIAINPQQYADVIRNLSAVRAMLHAGLRIAQNAYSATDVEDYISRSQAEVLQVQTTTSIDKIYDMEALMVQALDRIEQAQTRDVEIGLKFGFPTLDSIMQVFGSKLIIMAGRPGMGKTALALSVARSLAERGVKTGYLSIEMDKESLSDRILGHAANINPLLFYSKNTLSGQSFQTLTDAAGYLSTIPLFIDDSDCKIQDVERKCRKFKKMGCEIILIDQLSKIRGLPGQSKFEQYSDNCSAIALIKKELRIPIVLLCQLNRNVEQRSDKRPELSDLKQTGMIEEDADMVLLIYRPGYYDENVDQSVTDIILAKNRQGARGVEQQVLFNAKRMMFELHNY